MRLNIDLHTHTNLYSQCSVLSPEALCETALERGLNALAITEHHYQWSDVEIDRLQARYPAIKLYAGIEISCTDGRDYVVFGLESGHRPGQISYEHLQALIDARPEAFAFIAHCFRHGGSDKGLAERQVDGIEVASYNILARTQPPSGPIELVRSELYHKWQQLKGWIPLYNSDGHSNKMIGTFWNEIEMPDGPPADEGALIRVLRQCQVHGAQDDDRIRRAINGWQG
jgi:hypothetical protein